MGAEERGNHAGCTFITELVAHAFDRQVEGIDIVTDDDTILAAVVKAQEQGKLIFGYLAVTHTANRLSADVIASVI